jgi:hypothetical protein
MSLAPARRSGEAFQWAYGFVESAMQDSLRAAVESYRRDGFLSPVEILSEEEAGRHRAALEAAETELGPLHYQSKVHTILRSPMDLARDSGVLDLVEALIGPDILLYNVTYVIKEPRTDAHVSWHQDLTYWGFSDDAQVSMWLALSPATAESGCMRMVPGSHLEGRREHEVTERGTNVLLQGQTVHGVAETEALLCPLSPGQAWFHHGWTLHASMPNLSADRRIGLNVQYIAPHMRQTKHEADSAMLLRGTDRFGHYLQDEPAASDLDPAAIARRDAMQRRYVAIAGRN